MTTGVSFFGLTAPLWRIKTLFEDLTEQPNRIALCFNLKKTESRFGTASAVEKDSQFESLLPAIGGWNQLNEMDGVDSKG